MLRQILSFDFICLRWCDLMLLDQLDVWPDERLPNETACVHTDLLELTFQRKEGQIHRRLKNKRSGEVFASCDKNIYSSLSFTLFLVLALCSTYLNHFCLVLIRLVICFLHYRDKLSAPINSQVHEWRSKLPDSYKKVSRRGWKITLITILVDLALVTIISFSMKVR